jgi:hypothetical protein
MNDTCTTSLMESAAKAFNDLSFIAADEGAIDPALPAEAWGTVTFQGDARGRLVVELHGKLLATIAANMLMEDTPPSPAMQKDALGELVNVICGSFLPHCVEPDAIVGIGAPETGDGAAPRYEDVLVGAETVFPLEGGWAKLWLYKPKVDPVALIN